MNPNLNEPATSYVGNPAGLPLNKYAMNLPAALRLFPGNPLPLGTSAASEGINFALVSTGAISLCLLLFNTKNECLEKITFDPRHNKTGHVWHILIQGLSTDILYAYQVNDSSVLLQDPYAKCLYSPRPWGEISGPYSTLAYAYPPAAFDWEDDRPPAIPLNELIIYEMHVRGYTQHPSSNVGAKGSYLGVTEKIEHLKKLGINAVELLPVQEFDELEYLRENPVNHERLKNYWGYSTVNFFSPMNRYAGSREQGSAIYEFKTMVKSLHKENIEVILDVVVNHTAEGNENGPTLGFKGLDNSVYYMLDENGRYVNFSGCGNTVNCNHPIVRETIIDMLRYWVVDMHVDGFRFDLASILNRDGQGHPLANAPLIEAITADPILTHTKLIAEAWDAAGLYQVGNFYSRSSRWSDWNGLYRDTVRRFLKGSPGMKGEFATRISGSQDLYSQRTPSCSINFVTAHDGFTLADLVAYNHRHNLENGENNQDGTSFNDSWNCGVEGDTESLRIQSLRNRQMRNFHLALMISQGVPMILMGDEYAHTKKGNNNTWCQDNALNWFDWEQLDKTPDFYRFFRSMIHFRRNHPILHRQGFLTDENIVWHSVKLNSPDWEKQDAFIAFTLINNETGEDLYIAFNATDKVRFIELPRATPEKEWRRIANTAEKSPADFYDSDSCVRIPDTPYKMHSHSAIILKAYRTKE